MNIVTSTNRRTKYEDKKFQLVLFGTDIERAISFIAGLPSLEYLQLQDLYLIDSEPSFSQSKEWCLRDSTFHKLKFLKLSCLSISRWDASFPLLETLVIRACDNLKEIPLSFVDIPPLKQIKLIWCNNKSLEASAVRIKEEVEAIERCDCVDITTQEARYINITCQTPNQLSRRTMVVPETNEYKLTTITIFDLLESATQLQILHLTFEWSIIVSELHLPSNIKKLVHTGTHIESTMSFVAGLPSSLDL
ncbi:hypothetical protein H5410_031637 [Solanum commersonii]|uniref:Disease resistance protein n=1 Tax=Solanum commersonii TaxID=4109 RepID=A0A9J5YHQ8_SOLCO|nr:hypothetical protein H5410_031637 [Solanum commersonii]